MMPDEIFETAEDERRREPRARKDIGESGIGIDRPKRKKLIVSGRRAYPTDTELWELKRWKQ